MSTGKRTFAEFAAGSEPNLTVITADGGRIPAHYEVLRLVCSCLRNAPASDTWDLSSLLVNGSPVSQSTVTAVLSVIYSSMGALDFQLPHAAGQYSLAQLLEMLLFADAVGCSRTLLTAVAELLVSGCVRRQLEVTLPFAINYADVEARMEMSEAAIEAAAAAAAAARAKGDLLVLLLQLDGVYGLDEYDSANYGYSGMLLKLQEGRKVAVQPQLCLDHQQKQQLDVQLSAQLEALLYVGFKLDLQQLLEPALRFARDNAPHLLEASLRRGTGALFSQRVLAAAGCADSSAAAALGRGLLLHPMGLRWLRQRGQAHWPRQPVAGCEEAMFTDVVYSRATDMHLGRIPVPDKLECICFHGTLTRDVYSFQCGTRVYVELSASGGEMSADAPDVFGGHHGIHFGCDVVLGSWHMFSSS